MEGSEKQVIRRQVAADMVRVAAAPPSCACAGPFKKERVLTLAGYRREELESLPPAVVDRFTGCGHPLSIASPASGEILLDLGCGSGVDLLLAAKLVGSRGKAIGVDMAEEIIAFSRRAAAGKGNVLLCAGFIEELPLSAESVDCIISNGTLGQSPDRSAVFKEMYRVLAPGGRIVLAEVFAAGLPRWVRGNRPLYSAGVAGAATEEEYRKGLEQSGFSGVRFDGSLRYDQEQLRLFLLAGITGSDVEDPCSGEGYLTGRMITRIAELLSGRLWMAVAGAVKERR